MSARLTISGLDFELRRGPRRKTLGLTVDRSGELVVHAPAEATEAEIRDWVSGKLLWVHKKLAQKQGLARAVHPPEFVSGESIFYLGRSFRLRLVDRASVPLRLNGDWFELRSRSASHADRHFRQWFIDEGTEWLRGRSADLERLSGQQGTRVIVSDLGFRWGSCGKNGTLYFNWRLLQLPVRIIDYVVLHEQMHLLHHDHSPRFWKAMDRVLPDWRDRKEELETQWARYARFAVGATPATAMAGSAAS